MWELLIIFLGIVGIIGVTGYFKAVREGALGPRANANGNKELEALREQRRLLESRVENLESIVCSVDLELNARLAKLSAQQLAISQMQLSAPPPQLVAALGDGTNNGNKDATGPTLASPRLSVIAAPISTQLFPGQKVAARYVIDREIGHGGMGAVYLASDEKLGERVALKVVLSTVANDPVAAAERFRREVSAARKVTHPNIIRIHDLIEDGPLLLLSMEYVQGQTLGAYLGRLGALRFDEGRMLLAQICDGLSAAHAAGVVHRDLKPGNVLLDGERRVKVIDFGLAKASFLAGMTATGLILGTPEYMAPEQVRGLPCDARTDLYALGALAYHMLVGRAPFAGETPIAIGFAHVNEAPRPPRQLRPDLPEPIEAALLKALEKDPSRRFADAAEFKRALGA